jgi:hypothetical protein
MSRAFVFGLIVGLALLIVAGVGGARLQQKLHQNHAEEKQYRADLADATPAQLGVLTERQRTHSKLYTHYQQMRNGETISDLIANAKSKNLGIVFNLGLSEVLTESDSPEHYFGRLAGQSDAVIRGKATSKTSQVTEDEAFIFTDYDVVVTEVLKNDATFPVNVGATVTVTQPGGKVVIDGIILNAEDHYFAPLPINNNYLLLFLKFIPETGAFRLSQHVGGFELEGNTIRPLTKDQYPPGVLRDGDSLLRAARAVSNR